MSAPTAVTVAADAGVLVLTLNRPQVLNSLDRTMAREIQEAMERFAGDDGLRAMLLTGAGRGFCAGQDLAALTRPDGGVDGDLSPIVRECYNPIVRALRAVPKPVVCAVNGIAAGAGANLALACDIVLAADTASFVQSFCKVGLVPDTGGSFALPRLVGFARATALAMLGDKVDAATAERIGMIWRAVPAAQLMEEATALAKRLATQPTAGLGLIKRALNASLANDLEAQLALEADFQGRAGATADYREGVAAFLAKRAPAFTGR